MSRKIKVHPVEKLVDAYLSFKSNKLGFKKKVIEKAAKLIGISLSNPCCEPAEEVVLGNVENFFLTQVRAMLSNVNLRIWRSSLERAKTKLENRINNPCCVTIPSCQNDEYVITSPIGDVSISQTLQVKFGIYNGDFGNFLVSSDVIGGGFIQPGKTIYDMVAESMNNGVMPGLFIASGNTIIYTGCLYTVSNPDIPVIISAIVIISNV